MTWTDVSTPEGGGWHYVRGVGSTTQPRRHIYLDTEGRQRREKVGWTQVWRVGVAIFRAGRKGGPMRERQVTYHEPRDLWDDINAFIPARGRAVLWTHNLSYDLRISAALDILPLMGWRVVSHNLEPAGTWLAWRNQDRTMMMVDSASVFPCTVKALALYFGHPPLSLPGQDAPASMWERKCANDARILADACTAYLARIEAEGLGPWQPTGTGQAWAGFRARFLTHRMSVHDDATARAAERRAMWTGRCEAYWHGRTQGVRIDEWDMALAYPRIAACHNVPVELVTQFDANLELDRWMERDGYDILARVRVSTEWPLVPADHNGRITWPIGEFETTLWGPELRLLRSRGAGIACLVGWAYRTAPALAAWARWVLATLATQAPETEGWWAVTVKHWGRALIGRLAMTHRVWEYLGTAPNRDVRQWVYIDRDTGERGTMVQIGNDVWIGVEDTEWRHAQPAITGWVMSQARAELTTLIMDAPERSILYADTDSILISSEQWAWMEEWTATHPELGLRLKRSWDHVQIMGPRQIITGPRVRVSGIPVRAERLASGDLVGEVWQSLRGALTDGRPAQVRITPRRWRLLGTDARRVAGPDGWTVPHVFGPPGEP